MFNLASNEMLHREELAQSQAAGSTTVWMMENELVPNELKRSRDGGGIGRGELRCSGYTLKCRGGNGEEERKSRDDLLMWC